jgi:hypothetical protein
MKEGAGLDHLAIAWQYSGQPRVVIPAEFSRVLNPSLGGAILDTWTGIGGTSIADLEFGTNNYSKLPDRSAHLVTTSLEAPSDIGDNYGSRMKGWLVPPVTGDYTFWIASDDNGELWLSTSSNPTNKVLACFQPWSAPPRDWTRYAEQKSRSISLVAGRAYYYEVRDSAVFTPTPVPMILMQYYALVSILGSHERRRRQR